jgi:hypothetical protein
VELAAALVLSTSENWIRGDRLSKIHAEVQKRRPGLDTQRLLIDTIRYPHMFNNVPDPALWICDEARLQIARASWGFFPHPKDDVIMKMRAVEKLMRCERSGPCPTAVYKVLDVDQLLPVMGRFCRSVPKCRDTWFKIDPPSDQK